MKALHKCLNLAWRACQITVPIKKTLHKISGIQVDPICPRCGEKEETGVHALIMCEEVRRVWFSSPFGGRVNVDENTNFAEWVYTCLELNDLEYETGFFFCLMWFCNIENLHMWQIFYRVNKANFDETLLWHMLQFVFLTVILLKLMKL